MMVHCITLLHGLMQWQLHEAELKSPVSSTQKMGVLATCWEFLRSVLYVLQRYSKKSGLWELFSKWMGLDKELKQKMLDNK